MGKRLSIVLLSARGGASLAASLRKLSPGTSRETEIVIVCDGNKGEALRAVQPYVDSCDIAIVESEAALSLKQVGMKRATGAYVAFFNEDAEARCYCADELEKIALSINCDVAVWNGSGEVTGKTGGSKADFALLNQQIITGRAAMRKALCGVTVPFVIDLGYENKLFRRALLKRCMDDFPRVNRHDDWMPLLLMGLADSVCVGVASRIPPAPIEGVVKVVWKSPQPPFSKGEVMFPPLKKGVKGISIRVENGPEFPFVTAPISEGGEASLGQVPKKFAQLPGDELLSGIRHMQSVMEKHGLYRHIENLFVRFFGDVLFNQSLRALLGDTSPSPDTCATVKNWLDKVLAEPFPRRLFFSYMALPENSDERLCWATLRNRCADEILNPQLGKLKKKRADGGLLRTSPLGIGSGELVTIVTIVKDTLRNERRHLFEKMLASVAAQDYGRERLSHIVIDGASTDGTTAYLNELGKAGVIDYWLSEPDGGIYNAMNKGATTAVGAYVLYLNSDDFLAPGAISSLVDAINRENADYAYADAGFVDEHGQVVGNQIGNMNTVFFGSPYCHQTLLCKQHCFDKVRYDESFKITMWKYAIDLFLCDLRFAYVNREVAYFRVGGISTGEASRTRFFFEQERIRRDHILPQVDVSYEEYEYIDNAFRQRDTRRFCHIDARQLCDRLKGMRNIENKFARAFGESALRLVTCVWDDKLKQQVLQSRLETSLIGCN